MSPPMTPKRLTAEADVVGGIATFNRSKSALVAPGVVLEAGEEPGRHAGEQDRIEVGTGRRCVGGVGSDIGEHAWVERVE